jgi:hypothetical protein
MGYQLMVQTTEKVEVVELAEMIDIVCPQCRAMNGSLLPGGFAGVKCRNCKVMFVAQVIGRTLIVVLGEPYRRGRPCEVKVQVEPLLPKPKQRYERPETLPIVPVPMPVIDT